MHAVNNVLGHAAYDAGRFDDICRSISTDLINPHRNFFGGDYDVNVMIIALQGKGFACTWLDARRGGATQEEASKREVCGYLVNKKLLSSPAKSFFKSVLGMSGRHWICARKMGDAYYLLDSKREQPEEISSIEKFLAIETELGSHVLQVCFKPADEP